MVRLSVVTVSVVVSGLERENVLYFRVHGYILVRKLFDDKEMELLWECFKTDHFRSTMFTRSDGGKQWPSLFLTHCHISWLRFCRVSDVAVVEPGRRHRGSGDQVQEGGQHHAATPGWPRDLRPQLKARGQGARSWRSICLAPGLDICPPQLTVKMKWNM